MMIRTIVYWLQENSYGNKGRLQENSYSNKGRLQENKRET